MCLICSITKTKSLPSCTVSYMADPDDYSKYYYSCNDRESIRLYCPPGSIWDAKINACDRQQNTQCKQQNKSELDPNGRHAAVECSPLANPKCGTQMKSICYGEHKFPLYYSNCRTFVRILKSTSPSFDFCSLAVKSEVLFHSMKLLNS